MRLVIFTIGREAPFVSKEFTTETEFESISGIVGQYIAGELGFAYFHTGGNEKTIIKGDQIEALRVESCKAFDEWVNRKED